MSSPVEEIKLRLPLEQVVGEYVQLAKAGSSLKARCPFHSEKTPSFYVSPARGVWHCFGCQLGGDVFTFLEKIEGIEFGEALRILADKAGLKLEPRDPVLATKKTRLLDLLADAARYYQAVLAHDAVGKEARAYLGERKVSQGSIKDFEIGYAPQGWHAVLGALTKKDYRPEEVEAAGLAIHKDGRFYDRFRGRLMFPLANTWGQVVGFAGRILPVPAARSQGEGGTSEGNRTEERKEAKYVNTPETIIYHKGSILFGLDRAKQGAQQEKTVVLVEGYLDVIASHAVGVTNVVATSGSAFTEEQARLVARYAQTLLLAFDPDAAGEEAAKRALAVASREGLEVKVISLASSKDPDEVIHEKPGAWEAAIRAAVPMMDVLLVREQTRFDLSRARGKQDFAASVLPTLALLADPIETSHYLEQVARLIETPANLLHEQLQKLKNQRSLAPVRNERGEGPTTLSTSRRERVAERLLALAIRFPTEVGGHLGRQCAPDLFPPGELQDLYKSFLLYYTNRKTGGGSEQALSDFLKETSGARSEVRARLEVLLFVGEKEFPTVPEDHLLEQEIRDALLVLRRESALDRLRKIQEALRRAEGSGDRKTVLRLAEEAQALAEEIKAHQ